MQRCVAVLEQAEVLADRGPLQSESCPPEVIGATACSSRREGLPTPSPRGIARQLVLALATASILAGCGKAPGPTPRAADSPIRSWEFVDGFPAKMAVFQTVFWEPRDTDSLRELIATPGFAQDKEVLEIGTGSGLISLCCLRVGAARVVATDVNPNAIQNARYNARMLELDERLELRQVDLRSPGAFAVVRPHERFDLILSNPPWEDASPEQIADYALYDHNFELLRSFLAGLDKYLKPDGKAYLAYGCVTAVRTTLQLAPEYGVSVKVLDERSLDALEEVFLPGMLLELSVEPASP